MVRIIAFALGVAGLIVAGVGQMAMIRYATYTEMVTGVVSQRTDGFMAVRFVTGIPGGTASTELQYSVISGTRSDKPPASGPPFNLGDRVELVFPPGRPSDARLKDGFAPFVPSWVRWAGAGMIVLAIVLAAASIMRSNREM